MKRFYLLFILFGIWFPIQGNGQIRNTSISSFKNALFLGNSITYEGYYPAMLETFLLISEPSLKTRFLNLGLPSETVSGLSEENHADGAFPRPYLFDRLDAILNSIRPDLVFVCYGMNDGIYLPFDLARFDAYKKGIYKLQEKLQKYGVKRVIWLTPPVHFDNKIGLNGYNIVLDNYSVWLKNVAQSNNWELVDIHFPMKYYLESKFQEDNSFRLANDGIHPTEQGHWLMAKEILQHLNLKLNSNWSEILKKTPNIQSLFEAVYKRQTVMKDSWLTKTGHARPGMKPGVSLRDANIQYHKSTEIINQLTKNQTKRNEIF